MWGFREGALYPSARSVERFKLRLRCQGEAEIISCILEDQLGEGLSYKLKELNFRTGTGGGDSRYPRVQ